MNNNRPIRYMVPLAALALLANSPHTLAHEQEVHSTITRRAAVSSQNLKQFCFDALGVDMWANMPKFRYDSRNLPIFGWSELGKNAWRSGWLDKGSWDEDEPWYLPVRTENHFYTPVPRSRSTKALTDPPVEVGSHDSFNWASVSRDDNTESWPKARSYELDGLTNPSATARNASLGHMFYALGHVLHLNQDTSSPPHTRDDNHIPKWLGGPGISYFEEYGKDTYLRHGRRFGDDSGFPLSATEWSDWLAAGFTSLESFWDRNLYNCQPGALDANETGQGTANQLGLAEYCNGNFLSRHTLYPEIPGLTPRHVFPYPSIFDTDFQTKFSGAPFGYTAEPQTDVIMLNRIFLDKVADGVKLKNHAMLSYLAVNKRKKTFPYAISIHSDNVLGAYYTNLMPKAIEYSAGILDYFFRGRLEIRAYQDAGQYQLHVINRSGQPLSGGTFALYADAPDGTRTLVNGLQPPWDPNEVLADGATRQFTFHDACCPTHTSYVVVYQGTIGTGPGSPPAPPLDQVDGGIAIAAKCFQLLQRVAEAAVTDVSRQGTFSFGEHPPGSYVVKTCAGAWYYGQGWAVSRAHSTANYPPGPSGFCISVTYQGPSGEATATSNEPMFTVGNYATAEAAAAAACGCYAGFEHRGGEIKLSFVDDPYYDNVLGSPPPTYELFRVTPLFALIDVSDPYGYPTWSTKLGPNHYAGIFNIRNYSPGAWNNVKFTLAATGGITSPSAPITQSYLPGEAHSITFDWNASPAGSTAVAATIHVQLGDGTSLPDIVVNLTPIITPQLYVIYGPDAGGPGYYFFQVWVWNDGYGTTDSLQAVVTAVSGADLLGGVQGPVVASVTQSIGTLSPHRAQVYNLYCYLRQSPIGNTAAAFQFAFTDGPVTHPSSVLTMQIGQ